MHYQLHDIMLANVIYSREFGCQNVSEAKQMMYLLHLWIIVLVMWLLSKGFKSVTIVIFHGVMARLCK
jgi:mannose/fructose/N-acetylgalactosamine-specific phosphotransferase system component IID